MLLMFMLNHSTNITDADANAISKSAHFIKTVAAILVIDTVFNADVVADY